MIRNGFCFFQDTFLFSDMEQMHSGRPCEAPKISEGLHRTGGNIPTSVSATQVLTFVPRHEGAQKEESSKKNFRPATSWIKLNLSHSSVNEDATLIGKEEALKSLNFDVQTPQILSRDKSAYEPTCVEYPQLERSQDESSPQTYSLEIQGGPPSEDFFLRKLMMGLPSGLDLRK